MNPINQKISKPPVGGFFVRRGYCEARSNLSLQRLDSQFGQCGYVISSRHIYYISLMKTKLLGIALTIIICFLGLHGGYNHPSDSLFTGLLWLVETEGITFSFESLPLQLIIVTGILITASLLGSEKAVATGILLMMILLAYWIFLLRGAIVFNYLSMIPFVLVSCFGIWFCIKSDRRE